jgi:hypothetical protein
MSRAAYRYTLYRTKRWWPHDTVPVVEDAQVFLDLHDEAATLETVADLITRSGGREEDIGHYQLDVLDLHTGELVTKVAPTAADLAAARSPGQRRQLDGPGLEDVSDQALLWELARRLARR